MLQPAQSDRDAVWVAEALDHDPQYTVAGLVSKRYAAFVRILHPAESADGGLVTWGAIANAVGLAIHAEVQWQSLQHKLTPDIVERLGFKEDGRGFAPNEGDLPVPLLRRLFPLLAAHSEDPICMAAYWIGWGGVDKWPAPRICIPQRHSDWEYGLYRGTLADILAQRELGCSGETLGWSVGPLKFSPNFLWPLDRAWLLGTDVDFDSTVVGGSENLIADICAQSALEAVRVTPAVSLAEDGERSTNCPRE